MLNFNDGSLVGSG